MEYKNEDMAHKRNAELGKEGVTESNCSPIDGINKEDIPEEDSDIQPPPPKLTTCTDCGGVISTGALFCPHCGAHDPAYNPEKGRKITNCNLLIFIVVILVVFLIATIWAMVSIEDIKNNIDKIEYSIYRYFR